MATLSSVLAWRIPWTEEPGGLQPMGSQQSDTTEGLSVHTRLFGPPCVSTARVDTPSPSHFIQRTGLLACWVVGSNLTIFKASFTMSPLTVSPKLNTQICAQQTREAPSVLVLACHQPWELVVASAPEEVWGSCSWWSPWPHRQNTQCWGS